ncbi:hypothetical protein EVAR_56959_1 [Eumeta japonica]|uniref:Uncharacterized protein n=1 Tax=Eumeta variegata TaxID=151549 RepID=A0A4C1YQF5_EUMVA|nr:hypothetical protein EVAR_56959_1 [Eumeta japonica]
MSTKTERRAMSTVQRRQGSAPPPRAPTTPREPPPCIALALTVHAKRRYQLQTQRYAVQEQRRSLAVFVPQQLNPQSKVMID